MPDRRPLPGWPRGLALELAAAYVGLSESAFLAAVEAKNAPAPAWLTTGRKVWLRDVLDGWLDAKAGITPTLPPPAGEPESEWNAYLRGDGPPPVPGNLAAPEQAGGVLPPRRRAPPPARG